MLGCRHPPPTRAPRRHSEPAPVSRHAFRAGGRGSGGPHRPSRPSDDRRGRRPFRRGDRLRPGHRSNRIRYPTPHCARSPTPHPRACHSAVPTPGVGTRNLVWLDRVLAATLDAPLGDPPHWLELAACIPWPKRGHRRVRKCSLITHGTSRRRGRYFVPVRSRARSPGHRSVRRWPRGSMRDPSLVTALRRCPISTSSWLICTTARAIGMEASALRTRSAVTSGEDLVHRFARARLRTSARMAS